MPDIPLVVTSFFVGVVAMVAVLLIVPTHAPYIWLPVFLVQAELFGHLLVFRKLGRAA